MDHSGPSGTRPVLPMPALKGSLYRQALRGCSWTVEALSKPLRARKRLPPPPPCFWPPPLPYGTDNGFPTAATLGMTRQLHRLAKEFGEGRGCHFCAMPHFTLEGQEGARQTFSPLPPHRAIVPTRFQSGICVSGGERERKTRGPLSRWHFCSQASLPQDQKPQRRAKP